MDHPPKYDNVEASSQSQDDVRTTATSLRDAGRNNWNKMMFEPDQGAAPGQGSGNIGAGDLGPKMDKVNQMGGSDQDCGQQVLSEPPPLEEVPIPGLLFQEVEKGVLCGAFSGLHLRELERVFQRTRFPDVFERKELEISVNFPEDAAMELEQELKPEQEPEPEPEPVREPGKPDKNILE